MQSLDTGRRPRGALLLLVLGILTLFMLIGTVTLSLATRARTTSRAFAAATTGSTVAPLRARTHLEEALLRLIRGNAEARTAGLSESLLGDMYGTAPSLEGNLLSLRTEGTLVEATITLGSGSTTAADLCGRVVTFLPHADTSDSISTHRILRAFGSGTFTCWFSRLQSPADTPLPTPPCRIVVNPPAFRDEAYDAYDQANPWLTRIALEDGRVASVPRPAFAPPGAPATVDNDNDGVRDGIWLTNVLGSRPAAGGGRLEFDASYLVLDLDGRINLNAHGSRTSIDFPASAGWWTRAPSVPTGCGYGPADIDASLLFVDPLSANQGSPDPPIASDRWRRIVGDPNVGPLTGTAASLDQRRPVPRVGEVDGRYGRESVPGTSGNDLPSARSELVYGGNPLVDLKSMVKVQMETGRNSGAAVPKMVYYCPDWTLAGYVDDPYELRLDENAPRPASLRSSTNAATNPGDNPFTLADLEGVLRQFDIDAPTVSPRLAVALDAASQRSRMLVTTDSWDTPGLTGTVAAEIGDYIKRLSCDPADVMSPDVLAGLRFDLNRPFMTGTAEAASKQDYCKHLFTLLVALGRPADASTAQWAANVVDFRDPDSKFTRFQFDTTPEDGWNKTQTSGTTTSPDSGWNAGNVVWGVERPEVVLAQTLAWREENNLQAGELFVSLHRPWLAEMIQASGTAIPVDVLDPAIASSKNPNVLDLSKRVGNDPIWRLRFDENSKFVRFDPPQQDDSHPAFPAGCNTFTSTDKADMPPNSYLVVQPRTPTNEIRVASGLMQFKISKGGTFRAERWSGAGNDQPGSDTMIFLERLADPSLPWNATTNPFVVVDQLGIKLVNRSGIDPNNWRSFFRDPPFWRHRPFTKIMRAEMTPLDAEATNWLPWPNRALISHGELLLVPPGDTLSMFTDYDIPKNRKASNPYYFLPTPKLLDAAIVPSRFSGSQASVDPAGLAAVGMDRIPYNQLSRWREAGRVNLNTVVPNRNCAVPQHNDAVWWATLGPDAAVSLDEFQAAGPATSIAQMLTLMQEPAVYIDTAAAAGVKGNSWKKNRPYDLNPAAAYATATRLSNVATIRSHVFAVWVTLRIRDTSPGGIDTFHRLFAIVDRSRPVGYTDGQDLNVRDTIRVIRFLQ